MIRLEQIKNYFPPEVREKATFQKYMLKEYLQLLMLDYLSTTPFAAKIAFIGGTNLRLLKGIDRFSEDLDFDCKGLSKNDFLEMSDDVFNFLLRSGFKVEIRDRDNSKLKAFRRNIYFPGLLMDLGLTGHREERFLIKIECQDQGFDYKSEMKYISGCGMYFPFPVAPDEIICSMKLSAMLNRQKGRDFYDCMFLLAQVKPDYTFLNHKLNISTPAELKATTAKVLKTTDLNIKKRDFEHLLFNSRNSGKILSFEKFMDELK